AATVAVAGIAAAGCGGGGDESSSTTETKPVVEWADGFCTDVTTWKDQLTKIGQDFLASPSKESLQTAADDVKAANQKLSDDLKSLGTPDTESGDKVKQSVDDLSDTLNTQMDKIDDAVNNTS